MKGLRIGYLSTMYHTSNVIKGLKWVEEFLDAEPEWILFGTGPSMVEAFKAGAIDIGYIGLPPAMIGVGKGGPLKCIGGGHVEGTVMIGRGGLSSLSDSGEILPVLEQFEGKNIGSPSRGSIHDVIIRFLIKRYGIGQVEIINYPWADLIPEAIREGEIDGAVGTPPLAVLAVNGPVLRGAREHRALQVRAVAGLAARSLVAVAPVHDVPAVIRPEVRIAGFEVRNGMHPVRPVVA